MALGESSLLVRDGSRVLRVACQQGETILQALRRAGWPVSTQCEKGYCGSCIFQLLDGDVTLRANDVLSSAELAGGLRLACQGIVASPQAEIELL